MIPGDRESGLSREIKVAMHVMGPIGEEEGHVHSLGCRLKGRFPVDHLTQVGIMLAGSLIHGFVDNVERSASFSPPTEVLRKPTVERYVF